MSGITVTPTGATWVMNVKTAGSTRKYANAQPT